LDRQHICDAKLKISSNANFVGSSLYSCMHGRRGSDIRTHEYDIEEVRARRGLLRRRDRPVCGLVTVVLGATVVIGSPKKRNMQRKG
jgi:hypothetical protein